MINQTTQQEYDRWLTEQINCLKSQDFGALDLENLIEELEALGRAEKAAVKSLAFQILLHLLLTEFWTEQAEWNKNHWRGEIIAFKFQLNNKLTTNYKTLLKENLPTIYAKARAGAIAKTGLDSDRFPEICPYSLENLF